jgi:4,5:9,10-diseco-3-hydroxy-5,9,17-trioxoandrosta-1(10),2-diene-4-oate hydrolase
MRVVGLMDTLGIEQAAVVGHSMGGSVAAHLALTYPDRVSQLVLVDAAMLPDARMLNIPGFLFDLPFARRWAQLILRRALVSMSGDLILDAAYNDALITPDLIEAYARTLHTPEWDLGLLGIMRDADRNALPAPLSQIRAPTLILWGAEDTWVAPGDGAELERLIPDAKRIEFPNAGHLPMHEVPQVFDTALIDFLNQAR